MAAATTMTRAGRRTGRGWLVVACAAVASTVVAMAPSAGARPSHPSAHAGPATSVIPKPVTQTMRHGHFALTPHSRIVVNAGAAAIGADLAARLRPATGFGLRVASGSSRPGDIDIALDRRAAVPGDQFAEGYRLDVRPAGVTLRAATPHGLFNGVQTIRQLLPAAVAGATRRPGPWTMPATHIVDFPRYGYRGFMLDIARHFEPPSAVKRMIDEAAQYKINTFHLHLSDDQGFRIVINGFPRLTSVGSQGSVGTDGRTMDPGGFWTQRDYRSVVAYAAKRFVTVVPEVDTPGHNNAIIMSEYDDTANPLLDGHPQDINCSRNNPPKWNFTGDVGYSALCPESANTWTILTAIINQLSHLSPGPYYNLGGDEVPATTLSQDRYAALVSREAGIVAAGGKTVMGWAEISSPGTRVPPGSIAEYWNPASGSAAGTETATDAVAKGMKLVMAPANHAYLDQKYAPHVPANIGLTWACNSGCDVDQFYNWDPASYVSGIADDDVIGVEGALWAETIRNRSEAEYLAFPRLPALAELGWSPRVTRTADSPAYADFLGRLGAQGARWQAAGTNFYPTPEVPWVLTAAAGTPRTSSDHGTSRVSGALATVFAPGVAVADVSAVVHWGDGSTSAARVTGAGPMVNRVNRGYAVRAAHTYVGRRPGHITVTITAAGSAPITVGVPLR
jgi:hexosaminidase